MSTDLHHLAAAYALDALDPEERRAFEAHYPGCEICSQDVHDFRATAASLAAATPVAPPADLRDLVLSEIATTRQLSPVDPAADGSGVTDLGKHRRRRRVPVRPILAAAAVLLLVVAVVGLNRSGGDDGVDDLLAAPDAVVTNLEGTTGDVRLVWSPERDQVAVFAVDLPDPGDEQTYELWFVADGDVQPAALFRPDDGTTRTVLDVNDVDPDAWGVTIEPAGGSDQPTGEILYTGTA